MDDESVERMLELERLLMVSTRDPDVEELQIEEIDNDLGGCGDGAPGPSGGFTFNTCLASLHTYLGEVDDTHGRLSFLDGGTILNLPIFYLEGVVLFPEATLPLKVVHPGLIAAVEKALNKVDAPCTIGVVRIHRHPDDGRFRSATVGTTAEIRQYRRLLDGSLNVVTRGQQRFHLRRRWMDVEGAPCGEVEIVQEDAPLRTPKDAFGQLASVGNSQKCSFSQAIPSGVSPAKRHAYEDIDNDLECMSATSIVSDRSAMDIRISFSTTDSIGSPHGFSRSDQVHKHEKMSDDDKLGCDSMEESSSGKRSGDGRKREGNRAVHERKCVFHAPMSFWPRWVYQMYDAYSLARRAADLWKQIIGNPNMDDYVKKPDLLSFYIASKLPMSESTRQELLEIDGISYRLRREIQLLEGFNLIRCKNCLILIAKRSDMVVMSSDGPLNAYVNPHGFVHEIITVYDAMGLALLGRPDKEYSWFPGYAWTVANCAACGSNMGWLFTATKKKLLPKSFWGIRSSQVTDDT